MSNRDFNRWFSTIRDTIASWTYYTDFPKVYRNTEPIKVELNILNSLLGSKNIKDDFIELVNKYPSVLKAIPILIAKRESEICINDKENEKYYKFNFNKMNYSIDQYITFMEKTGLFELFENHVIGSLVDYVTGVEVGLDSNGRKNRTGDEMEDIVESYIKKEGLIKGKDYFKEMYKSDVQKYFGIDLSNMSDEKKSNGKTAEKRFDFVIVKNNTIFAIECNFYSNTGSKPIETARSYKEIAIETKNIKNFKFVWFTDGQGWKPSKNNLMETFEVLDDLYNLQDLNDGILSKLLKSN